MGKSVWVIEQGAYSDYRVVGVFSSREHAQLVKDKLTAMWDEPSIAEWPLDPCVEELSRGYTQWRGYMLRDGTVESMEPEHLNHLPAGASLLSVWNRGFLGKEDCLAGTVLANDRDHAIKIFNEQRTKLIALNKW
jgi:hypothetical protein